MTKLNRTGRSSTLLLMIFFAVNVIFVSCSKSHDTTNTPTASLMAFNLAPDKSAIGFSLSGSNLTTAAMAYANYTGNYLNINPGDKNVEAYDFNSSAGVFATTAASFKVDHFYSAFLVGKGAYYRNIVVDDNIDLLSSTSGLAYIRYVHAIPDSTAPLNVLVTAGSNNVINDTSPFPTVSGFTGVTPGNITITIANSNGIAMNKTITVEQKKVYTILLVGIQNSSSTPLQINSITNGTLDK